MLRKIMKIVRLTDNQIRDRAKSIMLPDPVMAVLSPEVVMYNEGLSSFIYDFMVSERENYTFLDDKNIEPSLLKQCRVGLDHIRSRGVIIDPSDVVIGDKSYMLARNSRDSDLRPMTGELSHVFGSMLLDAEHIHGVSIIPNQMEIVSAISELTDVIERDIILASFETIQEDEVIIFPQRQLGAINLYLI